MLIETVRCSSDRARDGKSSGEDDCAQVSGCTELSICWMVVEADDLRTIVGEISTT